MRKPRKKRQGLGDVVESITQATGIDKVVHAVLGDDCGCDERKEKLNKLFPFGKRIQNSYPQTFYQNSRCFSFA